MNTSLRDLEDGQDHAPWLVVPLLLAVVLGAGLWLILAWSCAVG